MATTKSVSPEVKKMRAEALARAREAKPAAAVLSSSAPVVPPVTDPSPDAPTANKRLAAVAKAKDKEAASNAAHSPAVKGLPALPKMPRSTTRKSKPPKPCECGCAEPTKGGRFLPGHDARLHAWALRVERKMIKPSEVPAPHTEAVKKLLSMRTKAEAAAKQ